MTSIAFLFISISDYELVYAKTNYNDTKYDGHSGWLEYDMTTNSQSFHSASEIAYEESKAGYGSSSGFISYSQSNYNLRGIVGSDDRTRIDPTDVEPYKSTVKISFNDGGWCTGFIIGPYHAVTAGHCLYIDLDNDGVYGWRQGNKLVEPAINGTSGGSNQNTNGNYLPYGSSFVDWMAVGGDFANNPETNNYDDWGIVRMISPLGNNTGWMPLYWQNNNYSTSLETNLNGYPAMTIINGVTNNGYMFLSTGNVDSSLLNDNRTISTNMDSSGNDSGGPIYAHVPYSYNSNHIIGLLRGGDSTYSDGTKIDEWLYNNFIQYETYSP